MSPTQRTLRHLRGQGFHADICERFIAQAGIRRDLFGFADLCAFDDREVILVQCCAASSMSARIAKIAASECAPLWLKSPRRAIWVVGWRKYAAQVDRRFWRPRIEIFEDADILTGKTREIIRAEQ